jgi:hypothetical protein
MQRPASLPANLPPPQIKVGWNAEHVVMIIVFGQNEIPLPFDPAQAKQVAAALYGASTKVEELQGEVELSPAAQELLEEAQARTGHGGEQPAAEDDLTFSVDTRDEVVNAAGNAGPGADLGDEQESEHIAFTHDKVAWRLVNGILVEGGDEQPPVADAVTDSPID